MVLQLATSIILARLLGAGEFGAFSYAFVWAALIGLFLPAGLGHLGMRELPKYISDQDSASLFGLLIAIFGTIAATGLIVGGALWALQNLEVLMLAPGWVLVTIVAMAHALSLCFADVLGAFQKILTAQVMESLPRQALFLVLVVLAVLTGIQLSPSSAFLFFFLGSIPALLLSSFIVLREIKQSVGIGWKPKLQLRDWYVAGLPMALTGFAAFLTINLDILMVGSLLGDVDTGLYRAAARAATLVATFQVLIIRVLGPMLSRVISQDDHVSAQQLLAYSAGFSTCVGLVFCILLILVADPYLGLFGPEFIAGTPAMILLVIVQTMILPLGAVALLALLLGYERLVFWVNLGGLALNAVLNWFLIQTIGIEGAALATGVTLLSINGSLLVFMRSRTKLDPTILATWRHLAARHRRTVQDPPG